MTKDDLASKGLNKNAEELINHRAKNMTNMFFVSGGSLSREEYENKARKIMCDTWEKHSSKI